MKIVYLCTDFGIPVFGTKGASIHVRELARALAARGHDVRIFTPRAGGAQAEDLPVPVTEIGPDSDLANICSGLAADPAAGPVVAAAVRALGYAGALGNRLAGALRDWRPDVVYERYALYGTAGLALARGLGVPLILEVNAPLADEQAAHRALALEGAARAIERRVIGAADGVIAVSDALAQWAVDLGADPARVRVLPNAVDPARFAPEPRARAALRRRLDAEGATMVGFVGTMKPWHDLGTLVDAVGALRRRGHDARLVLVGEGPGRAAAEARAAAVGLVDALTVTGPVTHAAVPAWLAAIDVAVAPYAADGAFYFSPLKLYEYLAAGLPVVAADIAPLAAELRAAGAGRTYAPGDAASLADALAGIADDGGAAAAMGAAGRAWVAAHRTWDHNARAVEAVAARSAEVASTSLAARPMRPAAELRRRPR